MTLNLWFFVAFVKHWSPALTGNLEPSTLKKFTPGGRSSPYLGQGKVSQINGLAVLSRFIFFEKDTASLYILSNLSLGLFNQETPTDLFL